MRIGPDPGGGREAGGLRLDVPVLTALGATMLVFAWDVGGASGLVFPGVVGWLLLLVAAVRAVTGRGGGARRLLLRVWLACGLGFGVVSGGELLLSHGLPAAWRAAAVRTLHIRRVYREYGP